MEKKYTIFVVDDEAQNRKLLANLLSENTGYNIKTAGEGKSLLDMIKKNLPDLILMDIMMPGMDGFEISEMLKINQATKDIPIIFITALSDIKSKVKAFEKGGVDYITKPFNVQELLIRVTAHIRLKKLQDELKQKNKMLSDREVHLSHLVEEKTNKIEKTTIALVNALENANLFNDDDTGNHIKRIGEYSMLIAEKYGADSDFIKRTKLYASLHDVGKVGLPDVLLKKPGKYTEDERANMQEHVVIGARMLDNDEIDVMAKYVAFYHHEKWDGSGYVTGLSGNKIPLEARIVGLADVYDALVSKRVYKEAFPEERADAIIREGSGKHFDPSLVKVFFENKSRILEIKEALS